MIKHHSNKTYACIVIFCVLIGITGNVKVDNNGDREPDYWIWDLAPAESSFKVALEARLTSSESKVLQLCCCIIHM